MPASTDRKASSTTRRIPYSESKEHRYADRIFTQLLAGPLKSFLSPNHSKIYVGSNHQRSLVQPSANLKAWTGCSTPCPWRVCWSPQWQQRNPVIWTSLCPGPEVSCLTAAGQGAWAPLRLGLCPLPSCAPADPVLQLEAPVLLRAQRGSQNCIRGLLLGGKEKPWMVSTLSSKLYIHRWALPGLYLGLLCFQWVLLELPVPTKTE